MIENKGPVYIRLDKGPFPFFGGKKISFSKGFRILNPLQEINLITNRFMIRNVLKTAKSLKDIGVRCGVIDLFRVKPFPEDFYYEVIRKSKKVISIEESCKTGGLGSALSEVIAQNKNNCQLQIIGAPDKQFIEYGDREWFHKKYNLDENGIIDNIINQLEN